MLRCSKCGVGRRHRGRSWCIECFREEDGRRRKRDRDERLNAGHVRHAKHMLVTQDGFGGYYYHKPPNRKCLGCGCVLSIFNMRSICRLCSKRPIAYRARWLDETLASEFVVFARGYVRSMIRADKLPPRRQDTESPEWVHPLADALEQWDTWCEEVYT